MTDNACKTLPVAIAILLCYPLRAIYLVILFAAKWIALLAWDVTTGESIRINQELPDYAHATYEVVVEETQWVFGALDTINVNIHKELTQMRDQLEARHTKMVNNITQNTVDTANQMGCEIIKALGGKCNATPSRRRLEGESTPKVNLDVIWPDGDELGVESVWELMTVMHNKLAQMHEALGIDGGNLPGPPSPAPTRSKKAKQAKQSSSIFTFGEGDARRRMIEDETNTGVLTNEIRQTRDRMGVVEGKMDSMKEELGARMGVVEGKVNVVEGKVNVIEEKVNSIEGKMDALIDLVVQLTQAKQ